VVRAPQGYAELQTHLQERGIPPAETLVVMEATGSSWISLAGTLAAADYPVSVVTPCQAHDFAKALLNRAKTDAIDVQTLAQRTVLLPPDRWTPPPAVYAELQQRLAQRDTLLALRQQVRNQLHALQQGPVVIAAVRQRMEALIATLTAQIRAVEAEIAPVLQQDEAWAHAAARLQSSKSIGLLTATWLLVPTLTVTARPTAEAATAYAGLAPYGQLECRPHQPAPHRLLLSPLCRRQTVAGGPLRGRPQALACGLGRRHQRAPLSLPIVRDPRQSGGRPLPLASWARLTCWFVRAAQQTFYLQCEQPCSRP
jgi:hypothetical protein